MQHDREDRWFSISKRIGDGEVSQTYEHDPVMLKEVLKHLNP